MFRLCYIFCGKLLHQIRKIGFSVRNSQPHQLIESRKFAPNTNFKLLWNSFSELIYLSWKLLTSQFSLYVEIVCIQTSCKEKKRSVVLTGQARQSQASMGLVWALFRTRGITKAFFHTWAYILKGQTWPEILNTRGCVCCKWVLLA